MKDAASAKKESPRCRGQDAATAAASNVSKLYYSTKEFGAREETKYRRENVYAGDEATLPNSALLLNQEPRGEGAKSLIVKKPQGRKLAQKKGAGGTGRLVGFENQRDKMGNTQTEHRMDLRNLVSMSMVAGGGAADDSFNAEQARTDSQKRGAVYVS